MGWRWRPFHLLVCLIIHSVSVRSQEDDNISLNDLLIIEDDLPISMDDKSNIQKRDAGCIFEPEIIPEGSEQFGIRLRPLKAQSTSFLEPAASTYQATKYQPVRYNLPPLTSNENNNVNNIDYPPYGPPPKTTRNPYSISNYKATTPKYPLTSPEPDDEAEPAQSGDVYEAVKPSTAAPEYLPPFKNVRPLAPRPTPERFSNLAPKQPYVQQPTQNVNYIRPAPKQQLVQTNYLPPDTASSNVDAVKQPFDTSAYYTPTVPTRRPVAPQPTTNYYQTLRTTIKPIRVENLKNYLPPDSAAPSNANPIYVRPSTTTTTTTSPRPTIKASYEYLPPENPESTNDNPEFVKPAQQKKPVDGLANRFTTPDEHYHTLEELCNDPFHSFLCAPLKPRSKDRFKNRNSKKTDAGNIPDSSFLQPRVVAPSTTTPRPSDQPLVPAASFQDISKTQLPEERPAHDCDKNLPVLPASSINQLAVTQLPEATYLPPISSTTTPVSKTTAAPKKPTNGLYAKNPFSELIFENTAKPAPKLLAPQPFVAATYLQPQVSYLPPKPILPAPSNNQFQFVPRQFPSTIRPLKIKDENCNKQEKKFESPSASSVSENVAAYNYPQPSPSSAPTSGYNYPQPAASSVVTSGYNYPQPAPSNVVTTGYSYPQPSASSIVTTGYNYPQPSPSPNYPQPAASDIVTSGYNYPQPSPSSVATTGYDYPQPSPSAVVSTGYNYPQPSPLPSSTPEVSTGYNYPQPNPAFNEVPEASNEQPVATAGYQYPVPAFNQQRPQPASIDYLPPVSAQPSSTTTTTTTQAPPSTTVNSLAYEFGAGTNSETEVFPPHNPNQFTFLPGEFAEINKFEGYTANRPKPSPSQEKPQFLGYNLPSPAKNDTPLVPAADTSNGYYYPAPQPVVPAASANVESYEGYAYPRPSDNQPVFDTTPKTESGYDYPVPPLDKQLTLPSNFFSQKVKLPVDDKKALVRFEKEDCDRKFHSAGSQVTLRQQDGPQFQSNLSPAGNSNIYVLKV